MALEHKLIPNHNSHALASCCMDPERLRKLMRSRASRPPTLPRNPRSSGPRTDELLHGRGELRVPLVLGACHRDEGAGAAVMWEGAPQALGERGQTVACQLPALETRGWGRGWRGSGGNGGQLNHKGPDMAHTQHTQVEQKKRKEGKCDKLINGPPPTHTHTILFFLTAGPPRQRAAPRGGPLG